MKKLDSKQALEIIEKGYDYKQNEPAYLPNNKDDGRFSVIYYKEFEGQQYIIEERDIGNPLDRHDIKYEYYELTKSDLTNYKKTTWTEITDPEPLREALQILKEVANKN